MARITTFAVVVFMLVLGLSAANPPADGVSYWLDAGRELANMTSYTASIQAYERAAALDPNDCATLVDVGNIYLRQADWTFATDAFNRALAHCPSDATALAGHGAALWGAGQDLRAINAWKLAATVRPGYFEAQLRLGDALIRRGELEEGVNILLGLEDQIKALPVTFALENELMRRADLALALAEAVDSPAAASRRLEQHQDTAPVPDGDLRTYLIAALATADDAADPSERARLTGIALAQAQAWAPAARALRNARSFRPDDAQTLALLGFVESQRGRPALDLLSDSVAAGPEQWISHYFLGQYLVKAGVPSQGVRELERSRDLASVNPAVLMALGDAYLASGDPVAAEEAFKNSVSLVPADVTLQKRLVAFYVNSAYKPAANGVPAALAASRLAPEDAELQDALGWLYWLSGDAHRAFLHLYTAWQLDPHRAETYYHLGRYYLATGWIEASQNAFRRASEMDTQGDVRARLRQLTMEMAR